MTTTILLTLILGIVIPIFSIKQSQAGQNDWALKQIGEITSLKFFSANNFNNQIYFQSELGIFGHLDKKTGSILKREHVEETEKIIESTDTHLIIWTKGKQLIFYEKTSLERSKTINSFLNSPDSNVNSYVEFADREQEVVLFGETHEIVGHTSKEKQFSIKIRVPQGTQNLKVFEHNKKVYSLLWNQSANSLCLNQIVGKAALMELKCLSTPPQKLDFHSGKQIYFSWGDQNYFLQIEGDSTDFVELSSAPLHYLEDGSVTLTSGRTFNPTQSTESNVRRAWTNHKQNVFQYQVSDESIIINEITQKNKNILGILHLRNTQGELRSKVRKVWVNFISSVEVEIYAEFEDLQFVKFEPKKGKQIWSREESLAYIQKVLFLKYEGFTDHLNNPYHMKVDSKQYQKLSMTQQFKLIPQLALLRIQTEIRDIVEFIEEKIISILSMPLSIPAVEDIKDYFKSKMDEYSEKKYGLRKYMIAITEKDSAFAIDTKTSTILWKKKCLKDQKLISLIKLKEEYEREIAVLITYSNGKTNLQEITESGQTKNLGQFTTETEPTIHKISAHSILIRSGKILQQYDINKNLVGEQKTYHFYEINQESNRVIGWKNVQNRLIQTWELRIPHSEALIKTSASYRGQPESKIPVSNDKKVIFKNVDFSNIAILTHEKNETVVGPIKSGKIILYLINGLTGTVQFTEYQNGVHLGLPVNLVYDENDVIVSYYNSRNRVYEIWTIEGYQYPLESELLSKPYAPFVEKQDIVFKSKVYGTVLHINSIHVSESKEALIKRNLVIISKDMRIYLMVRDLLSTRRPKYPEPQKNEEMATEVNSKYPADDYILPLNTNMFLTHQNSLIDIKKVRFSSTDLQSTIFIYAHGIDSFLIRIAPDKAFDMLIDGFNYIQLVLVLLVVTFLAVFFRFKLKEAKLKKPHTE